MTYVWQVRWMSNSEHLSRFFSLVLLTVFFSSSLRMETKRTVALALKSSSFFLREVLNPLITLESGSTTQMTHSVACTERIIE